MLYDLHMMIEKPKVHGVRVQLTETERGGARKALTLYGWTAAEVIKLLSDAYGSKPKKITTHTVDQN